MLELDFGEKPEKFKEEYLDVYGVQSEILSTSRYDENLDLSTTYLGRVNTAKSSKIKVEESFLISDQPGVYNRKIIGWNRMLNITWYRS